MPWVITGEMKVNKIFKCTEVDKILRENGIGRPSGKALTANRWKRTM